MGNAGGPGGNQVLGRGTGTLGLDPGDPEFVGAGP